MQNIRPERHGLGESTRQPIRPEPERRLAVNAMHDGATGNNNVRTVAHSRSINDWRASFNTAVGIPFHFTIILSGQSNIAMGNDALSTTLLATPTSASGPWRELDRSNNVEVGVTRLIPIQQAAIM